MAPVAAASGNGRVQVFARVRPRSSQEAALGQPCIELDDADGTLKLRNEADAVERVLQGQAADAALGAVETRDFAFDGTFQPEATQREVFTRVGQPVLRECLQGFNGTILAYGQTGSGKTHSLLHQGQSGEDAGILPRLVAHLFVHIAEDPANVYHIEAAALQVYNDQVDDLLHPEHQSGVGHNVSVQNGGVVPGLSWVKCASPETLLDAFTRARANVVYAETKMNKASSRSHAVFQIKITKRCRATATAGEGVAQKLSCTHARLSIVDLAGSERVKRSGVEGTQFKEATAINKSLLAFGNVVSALAAKKAHVPFRDSKLTRVLDGSIGGNCKTALLVCASPAMESAHESLSTFEFAARAMRVEVDAKVNESVVEVGAKALLADLAGNVEGAVPLGPEIEALRKASTEAAQRAAEVAAAAQDQAAQSRQDALLAEEKLLRVSQERMQEVERVRKSSLEVEDKLKLEVQEKLEEVANLRSEVVAAEGSIEMCRSVAQSEQLRLEGNVRQAQMRAAAAEDESSKAQARAVAAEDIAASSLKKVASAESRASVAEQHALVAETKAKSAEQASIEWKGQAEAAHAEVAVLREEIGKEWEGQAEAARAECASLRHELATAVEDLAAERLLHEEAVRTSAAEVTRLATEADTALDAERYRSAQDLAAAAAEACKQAAAAEAELAADRRRASGAAVEASRWLAAEKRRASEFQAQAEAATSRGMALEEELATRTEELRIRTAALCQAQEALASLQVESEETEIALRQEHAAELQSLADSHHDAMTQMHIEQALAIDTQRAAFEARLAAGRQEFEDRFSMLEVQAEQERDILQQRLEAQQADAQSADLQAREASESQQRRLAGVFKAARCVMAAKESELRMAHDELACRFAARESRPEDLRCIAEQKVALAERRASLKELEQRNEALDRQLRNRDASDKIFGKGSGELRRGRGGSASPGASPGSGHEKMPPLPGKKLNEIAQPFQERRRRLPAACRALSADPAPCDLPLSVR